MRTIFTKPLHDVDESDLEELVALSVSETSFLEFKEKVDGNDPDSKKILCGWTAFANTIGGDFIIGIREQGSKAVELVGLDAEEAELVGQRLRTKAEELIEPRLPSITKHPVRLSNGKEVLIYRIDRSWSGPHRVRHDWKFYKRTDEGKQPMNVEEIRQSFLLSSSRSDEFKRFVRSRTEQAAKWNLTSGARFHGTAFLMTHICPLSVGLTEINIRVREIQKTFQQMSVAGHGGNIYLTTLDGVFCFIGNQDRTTVSESSEGLFRNGAKEFVDVFRTRLIRGSDRHTDESWIHSPASERNILRFLRSSLLFYRDTLHFGPPFAISVSLVVTRDAIAAISSRQDGNRIPEGTWLIGDTQIDNFDVDLPTVMRDVFDGLYHAAGARKSDYYDDNGEWTGGVW